MHCVKCKNKRRARACEVFYFVFLASNTTLPTGSSLGVNPSSTLRVSELVRRMHCPVTFNEVMPKKLESLAQTMFCFPFW